MRSNGFMESLRELVLNCQETAHEKAVANPEYLKRKEEREHLEGILRARLGPERQQAYLDYEAAVNEETCLVWDEIYLQGARDGFSLHEILGGPTDEAFWKVILEERFEGASPRDMVAPPIRTS